MTVDITMYLSEEERSVLDTLTTPIAIQTFLDSIPYAPEDTNRCPVRVLRERRAHCLDGGLFAAAALSRLGQTPIIVDLLPEPGTDDDHVLAIYTRNGCFGAVAKSNFVGLRFREAVYQSIRELIMSYFDVYFNIAGDRTLRAYTLPLDLTRFDHTGWLRQDSGADAIEEALSRQGRVDLITPTMAAALSKLDRRSYDAGVLGANPEGFYSPHTGG